MSRDFLSRNNPQFVDRSKDEPSQKKADSIAQLKWLNAKTEFPSWGRFSNYKSGNDQSQPAQMFANEEEEQIQGKSKNDELQMKEELNNSEMETKFQNEDQIKTGGSIGINNKISEEMDYPWTGIVVNRDSITLCKIPNGRVLVDIPKGSIVKVIGELGNWYKIETTEVQKDVMKYNMVPYSKFTGYSEKNYIDYAAIKNPKKKQGKDKQLNSAELTNNKNYSNQTWPYNGSNRKQQGQSTSTSIFKFIFGSPKGLINPATPLDYMSNDRLKKQRHALNASRLYASYGSYAANGGASLYKEHDAWGDLGSVVNMPERKPDNIVDVNSTPSAIEHNERINDLNKQFRISPDVKGSEIGLVNLLLGSFFKGNSPENIIFPTDGFGSNFLRDSPQVNQILTDYAQKGISNGKADTPSIESSITNALDEGFKLQDFIGSIDYKIDVNGDVLLITLTNVTSLTSGTLGKELDITSELWPRSILKGSQSGTNEYSNFAQTYSMTFSKKQVLNQYKNKK